MREDQVLWPGMEPEPPALGAKRLSYWVTREVPLFVNILVRPEYSAVQKLRARPVAQVTSDSLQPMYYSRPGSTVHEISQARIPESVAFSPPGNLCEPGIKPESLAFPELTEVLSIKRVRTIALPSLLCTYPISFILSPATPYMFYF